ncbi:MAG: universal stress protein [Thermoplasmata archaeon]|nr:MAG: universal stress protein [Thermoplasmata archaeon]
MINKILVPTDGYGLEDHVIRYVAKAFPSAEFYIISVVNTYERGVQLTNLLYKEMRESAEKAIERAKNLLEEEKVKNVKSRIIEGLPSKMINRYAKRKDVDLVAMRVYSRKLTVSAQRMGSTLRNVLKDSNIPILTLAEECNRIPIKKILFPTDGTRKSERAKNFSILFASSYKSKIEILHVMKEKNSRQHADEILKNAEWKASFWDVNVEKSVEKGDTVEKILKHAEHNDVIIMGVGRRFLFWHTIGHVTQAVVTHSPIPVILVPCIRKGWEKRVSHK